jgi:AcrR family transcriptional regulator
VNESKAKILRVAEELLSELGVARTTIAQIAKKAKVSEISGLAGVEEGSIYDFFENKEDLSLSITEARLKEHMESLPETFDINTPTRKLRRFISENRKPPV